MSDKELIKQEIERLKNHTLNIQKSENGLITSVGRGRVEAFNDILEFIDSLPEEPESKDRINECPHWEKYWGCETSPMNNCDSCPQAKWVEVKEENENYNERYNRIAQTEQFKESYCGKSLGKEEPVSEDLEEEIENYIKDSLAIKFPTTDKEQIKADIRYIAHHFAEWQKQKDQETIELAEDHAMLAGMNKMKEEMMKDAVETIIVNDWQYGKDSDHAVIPAIHQRIDGFNVGDKVRIIIVKTEQQ